MKGKWEKVSNGDVFIQCQIVEEGDGRYKVKKRNEKKVVNWGDILHTLFCNVFLCVLSLRCDVMLCAETQLVYFLSLSLSLLSLTLSTSFTHFAQKGVYGCF